MQIVGVIISLMLQLRVDVPKEAQRVCFFRILCAGPFHVCFLNTKCMHSLADRVMAV